MKALLYCTKANGLLYKSKGETKPFFYECFKNKKDIEFWGKKSCLIGEPLNGTVCFECEINKVEEINYDGSILSGDFLINTKKKMQMSLKITSVYHMSN